MIITYIQPIFSRVDQKMVQGPKFQRQYDLIEFNFVIKIVNNSATING